MKRFHALSFVVLASLCSAFVGCGPKVPADFPQVEPFTVKVVDGDKPIEGVMVMFISDQNPVLSGQTDSKGVAEMTTMLQKYTAKGVPAGEYRVQCTKEPLAEHWKTPEEQSQMTKPEKDAYLNEWLEKCKEIPREIPEIWGSYDKTPLTVTVAAGGGEITYDVEGKANN